MEIEHELDEAEFKRLTEVMFPKWSKADTKIARFMRDLDPRKKYTEAEMKEYCKEKGINRLRQVMIYQGTTGHGYIIKEKYSEYYLYPELVKKFVDYF